MNRAAQKHLDQAGTYLDKGEEFYRKAAEEIIAAQQADPTLSNREIGEQFDRSGDWVRDLVRWATSAESSRQPTPYSGPEVARQVTRRKVRQVLREADPDELTEVLKDLPPERLTEIGEQVTQLHPATAIKPPLGLPKPSSYGFAMEMAKVNGRLRAAIREYVEAWEQHAPSASEAELEVERDDLAPDLLRLQATVEGVQVA